MKLVSIPKFDTVDVRHRIFSCKDDRDCRKKRQRCRRKAANRCIAPLKGKRNGFRKIPHENELSVEIVR